MGSENEEYASYMSLLALHLKSFRCKCKFAMSVASIADDGSWKPGGKLGWPHAIDTRYFQLFSIYQQ